MPDQGSYLGSISVAHLTPRVRSKSDLRIGEPPVASLEGESAVPLESVAVLPWSCAREVAAWLPRTIVRANASHRILP
jgi:hypothetical protein